MRAIIRNGPPCVAAFNSSPGEFVLRHVPKGKVYCPQRSNGLGRAVLGGRVPEGLSLRRVDLPWWSARRGVLPSSSARDWAPRMDRFEIIILIGVLWRSSQAKPMERRWSTPG